MEKNKTPQKFTVSMSADSKMQLEEIAVRKINDIRKFRAKLATERITSDDIVQYLISRHEALEIKEVMEQNQPANEVEFSDVQMSDETVEVIEPDPRPYFDVARIKEENERQRIKELNELEKNSSGNKGSQP